MDVSSSSSSESGVPEDLSLSFEPDSEEDDNVVLGLGNAPYQFEPYLEEGEGAEGAPAVVEEEEDLRRLEDFDW